MLNLRNLLLDQQEEEVPTEAPLTPAQQDALAAKSAPVLAQEEALNQPLPDRAPGVMPNENVNRSPAAQSVELTEKTRTSLPQSPAPGNSPAESPEARLERLMGELNDQRKKEREEAASREMKGKMMNALSESLGGIIGGSQAMNTGARVTPAQTKGVDIGDLVGRVDKNFAGDRQALMDQYKALVGAQDRKDNKDFQERTLKLKEKELNQKANKTQGQTEFDKAQMKKLGTNSAEYFTQNRDQLLNNANKLTSAIELLEKPKSDISGPGKSWIPDSVRAFTNPEAVSVQENIQSAITDTLRPTLGAQFTEGEGKRIMSLQYNPDLSPAENAKRARELQTYINKKVKATDALYEHLGQGQPLNTFDFKKYGMQPQQQSVKLAPAAKAPEGKVAVSDGSETLYIDPADLAEAEADGFKRLN